jgi:adenylosuccinate synthase
MADLVTPDFFTRLADTIAETNQTLHLLGAPQLDPSAVCAEYRSYPAQLKDYITDTSATLRQALKEGKTVLAEGAQGTLLDLDQGTYPFVTSSTTTAPGALTGLGLGLTAAQDARVTGVTKAFQTRVGSGPFPTEVIGSIAQRLRGSGEHPWDEYGTTTGRPRRVGWLDGVLLRYAVQVNGLTELVLTKLDILTGIEILRICTAYRAAGRTLAEIPDGPAYLEPYEPVYEDLPGWQEDVSGVRNWAELPSPAKNYIEHIGSLAGIPISLVSVGSEREQIVPL